MKKMLAVIISAMVLVGCGEKEVKYDCGSTQITLKGDKAILKDSKGSVAYDKVDENIYEGLTEVGKARIIKGGDKFTISLSIFSATKECKIIEGK